MKTKLIRSIALVLVMVMCMAVGAFAATNLQEIKAYLNHDLAIRYDGELQTMYDANGNRVLPISYNGTTYLPIRAVGNMMGIDVGYDAENYQVLLGKTGKAIDFIENFTPYSVNQNFCHYKEINNKYKEIGSNSYTNMIYVDWTGGCGYYDIEGKYDTLTFCVYAEKLDRVVKICGDNNQVLARIEVKAFDIPKTYSVKVTGVQQLSIETEYVSYGASLYMLNMNIE
ncbi:MAG: hypothetical protein E7604_10710 [Ruminococcaceae bacterium]|nr:hypothetical protein [Oscillospiraceae bacterium]